MTPVTEFDHPDHGWKWTELELRWINDRIAAEVAVEREACAVIADKRAERCEQVAEQYAGMDDDEVTSLRSMAWQFSVLAAEMRKRSNVKTQGQP